MISSEQLRQWKQEWRKLVAESIAKALEAIEKQLPAFSPKYKLLINLRARLNEANQGRIAGIFSNEQLQLEYNRIRMSLLETIDALTTDDFQPPPLGQSPGEAKKGYLLHKIPPQMQVGKEEECIIRLAYEQASIVQDIELSEAVEIKQVTVSKIMQAELIDPNEDPAFAIRTWSDEEQFLQAGEYTEWKFWVKPLREGTFALLLKVSVVEVVEGKERTRNLAWEEKVQIITEAPQMEPAFKESGIAFAYQEEAVIPPSPPQNEVVQPSGGSGKLGDIASQLEKMYEPGRGIDFDEIKKAYDIPTPRAPQPPAPAPSSGRRRALNIRRLSIAATVLIVIGVALSQLQLFTSDRSSPTEGFDPGPDDRNKGESPATDTLEMPEDLLEISPNSEEAEEALWELARKAGERKYYEQYLELYPEGKYVEEARKSLGRE